MKSQKKKKLPLTIEDSIRENAKEGFRLNPILGQRIRRAQDINYIKAVAEDIVKWANTPGTLTLEAFYNQISVLDETVECWCKKHSFLHKAVQQAKVIIGVRREEGLIKNKYNNYTARSLHHYLSRCRKSEEWHYDLKAKANKDSIDVDSVIAATAHVFKEDKKWKDKYKEQAKELAALKERLNGSN